MEHTLIVSLCNTCIIHIQFNEKYKTENITKYTLVDERFSPEYSKSLPLNLGTTSLSRPANGVSNI
jgi:hypothetical protein